VITNKNDTAQKAIIRDTVTIKSFFFHQFSAPFTALKHCGGRIKKAKWYYLSNKPAKADCIRRFF
jgi:hypothetical protein